MNEAHLSSKSPRQGRQVRPHQRLFGKLLVAMAMLATIVSATPGSVGAQVTSGFEDQCWIVADASGGTAADWLSDYALATDLEATASAGTGTNTIEAIAFHYPTGQLFATDQGQFGVLDLTGAGTFTAIGAGGLGDIDGLSFDATTGNLWGTIRNSGNDELIRIDITTGALVGTPVAIATTVYSGPLNSGGSSDLLDIDDLAVDPVSGDFYGIANGNGSLDMLVIVDPATGATTPIGSVAEGGVSDIEGLGFTPAGDLIGTAGNGGTIPNSIVDIDKTDGSTTVRNAALTYLDHEAVDCLTGAYYNASIDLEKATNTEDADTINAPQPTIAAGGTVTWTYEITNDGNLPLFDLSLTDDIEGAVTCTFPQPLFPTETATCELDGTAIAGQYTNLGLITGTPVDLVGNGFIQDPGTGDWFDAAGDPADFDALDVPTSSPLPDVTADDPSNYFGSDPQIALEKATNGIDADTPTGPSIVVGDTVTWTYEVTNPGNVGLEDITLTDDNGTAVLADDITPTYVSGDDGDDILNVGETWIYTAAGTATLGQYSNNATVSGTSTATLTDTDGNTNDEGTEVVDEDPSHYLATASPVAAIDIEKDTNGVQADLAENNVEVDEGDAVTWTYVVTNTGALDLTNVTVTDDVEGAVCVIDTLAIGESSTCTLTGLAGSTNYRNVASVSGQPVDDVGVPSGGPVTDSDGSGYDVNQPAPLPAPPEVDLTIDKSFGGTLTKGGTGIYVITVQNLGPDDATNITVTDVLPAELSYTSAAGDGWTCSAAGQTVTCARPAVAVGEVVPQIRLSVAVASNVAGTAIVNSASVTSAETETILSNNRDEITVSLSARTPTLALTGVDSWTMTNMALLMLAFGYLLTSRSRRQSS